jgi:uncharacterized membrane protein (UPF0127 family)
MLVVILLDNERPNQKTMIVKTKIKDNILSSKICATPDQIENGMMDKTFEGFDSMVFLMNGKSHSFWMKNCIIPLDIIFIKNNVVNKIHHDCPPCNSDQCESYTGVGNIVLELPGGYCQDHNIKEGDPFVIYSDSVSTP